MHFVDIVKLKTNVKGIVLHFIDVLSKYVSVLKIHLDERPKNYSYFSSKLQNYIVIRIQNPIILIMKSGMHNNKKKITFMADDTSDCSHHEVRLDNIENIF